MSKDALAAALTAAEPTSKHNGSTFKIDVLYGQRPEVLEAIRSMRRDRGFTYNEIADLLAHHGGRTLSGNAVKSWLKAQGIT